ncbi:efflux RND transporter periplasmic adaptor subunit [Phenylobacterium sp.]|uniref:efflux RND transporter periplasmic adaptor subunit n=1 Tax=Phenylobacterium sp. TaxID=1871053 RepID=UPI00391D89F5
MDQTSDARAKIDSFLGVKPGGRRPRPLMIAALAAVGVALALLIFFLLRGPGDAPRYATAAVEQGDLRVTVSATGNLAPTNEVEVGSELSGIVSAVYVDNNDRVTKGQLLARLDTSRLEDTVRESEAAVASAEASVAQAEATLTEARANLRRMEEVYRLSAGKAPSATELDVARAEQARAAANLRAAQAAVGQARASLSSNRTQLSKASIRSPVNGVVLSRDVEPGSTVAATLNAPVLFTLAEDLAKMQLEVKVDEADVGQVKDGQKATFQVDAYPGRTFNAVVKRLDVGATATASSSGSGQVVAYTAVLTADNPDLALRPGMTGTAAIVATEKRNVLLVPNAALRFTPEAAAAKNGGATSMLMPRMMRSQGQAAGVAIGRGSRQTVYVLKDNGELQAVQVQAGDSNGSQTEVVGDGLKAGMKVVTGQLAGAAQ